MIEGLNIEGNWLNKRTNKMIHVSNYVSDGDTVIVMTSEGRILLSDFMDDYIQIADDNEYDNNGNVVGKSTVDITTIKETKPQSSKVNFSNHIFDQEYIMVDEKPKTTKPTNSTNKEELITNEKIIKKLFEKIEDLPELEVSLKWDNFPKNELSTLVNILDVKIEDISKYIQKTFFDKNVLNEKINKIILDKFNDN